jgi:UDP-glucose 4-epimerase
MTRFLFTLSAAVDTIIAAIEGGRRGEIYVPLIPSARIVDVARALVGNRKIPVEVTGIRPGEKIHEVLIATEESVRAEKRGEHYCVAPLLPEIGTTVATPNAELWEYSSGQAPMSYDDVYKLLEGRGLLDPSSTTRGEELLR